MIEFRLDDSPFQRLLGLKLVGTDHGEVRIRLPFRPELLRQEGSDWLHGGVISSLIDIAGAYAVVTITGSGVPTIDLRVDWLRPARHCDLLATGRVVKIGRRVSIADIQVHDPDNRLIAVGRAAYATSSSGPAEAPKP